MARRTTYDFSGSVAIVTGAASGIGFETARQFLRARAHVALNDLDPVRLADAAAELAAEGGEILQIPCDVRNEAGVRAAVARVADAWGKIDALVNCAGIADEMKPTFQQDIDIWQKVLDVSLRGTYLFTREAARHMAKAGSGAVVALGSIAGVAGLPGRNAYSAAKAGIGVMTRALAAEWGSLGIRVNVLAPGYVKTPMVAGLTQRSGLLLDRILARTPMHRLAEPHEIANAALFLCSDAASFITGSCLLADGGWVAFGGSALLETAAP